MENYPLVKHYFQENFCQLEKTQHFFSLFSLVLWPFFLNGQYRKGHGRREILSTDIGYFSFRYCYAGMKVYIAMAKCLASIDAYLV